MKKYSVLLGMFAMIFFAATAFNESEEQPRTIVNKRFETRLKEYTTALQNLNTAAVQLQAGKTTAAKLREQYLQVRTAFKKWEYLAEHLDPVFMKEQINGAPLPKLERNSFGLNELLPKGMQVLDEAVFAENVKEEAQTIIDQTNGLLEDLSAFNAPGQLYDRNIFEGARQELIRIFTLGLTGFDVPGSRNAIVDATISLQTMQSDLALYDAAIAQKDKALALHITSNFRDGISYLKANNNFDQLDRLYVLKKVINPLFKNLLLAQQTLEIETVYEVVDDVMLPPLNQQATNLFANDFLDATRYLTLPKSLQSTQLVELGRTLFFDPILSLNNERSCASCHDPKKAFTDGSPKSMAMGRTGTVDRNAPTLINSVYSERYFYDLRAEALEDQMEHVVVNSKEFNTGMFAIASKLSESEEYQKMFASSFALLPGNKINKQTISFAMSAYVASLRGFNAPFDKYVRGEQNTIDASVQRGFNLFMGKAVCGTCHFAPVFNGTVPPWYQESESEVLAVPENPYAKKPVLDKDLGRAVAKLTETVAFYEYSFKTPTVRNIALTAPYMHNGTYKTLEDVMDFYNKGGGKGIGLKLEHQTLPFDKLNLSKQEIKDIIAFMNALTDTAGMTAVPESLPRFSSHSDWNNRKTGGEY